MSSGFTQIFKIFVFFNMLIYMVLVRFGRAYLASYICLYKVGAVGHKVVQVWHLLPLLDSGRKKGL